jgi:high-affinity iron transporter
MRRLMLHRHPAVVPLVVATIVLMTAVLVVGPAALSAPAPSPGATATLDSSGHPILITARTCAPGWTAPKAGRVVFRIINRTGDAGTIYLFNPYFGVTVAHAAVHPQATEALAVRLKAGRYKWSCMLQGRSTVLSSVQAVQQAPVQGPAGPMYVTPVYSIQMAPEIAAYRAYVSGELALEAGQVQLLGTAIGGGQMAAARAAWLTAHLTWHRIGGAYDAFGDLGLAIDGTAARLQTGIASPQFTGFHKVEMDLWQNDDLAAAATDTTTLLSDVNKLAGQFPHESIPATELPLRTHEILEDALRDELSGSDDYGSGTDMASVEADVDGTRELLSLLAPLLDPRAPDLEATAGAQLTKLDGALAATQVNGQWVAVTQVPLAQREQVDGDIGAALETLDLAPELLQVVGSTT